jgi:glutamate-ammonia-ligase adenylyltransferase
VQELIYCKPLSLSAIQTAARSLERIQRGNVRQSARGLDVKSGPGGLREIEFVVQCLQRVHGGGEPWLRSSGTLFALQKLHDKGHIGNAEFRELGETYRLLRAIEHRLQCRQGSQSHRLPESEKSQAALFRSIGEESVRSAHDLARIMKSASALCGRVLSLGTLEETGEPSPQSASLGTSGAEHLKRELAVRSEELSTALAAEVGNSTLRNLQRFLTAASTGEERIRTTLENAESIERALPVFAQSALATNILARHPEDIVALFGDSERVVDGSISDRLRIQSRRCILRSVGRTLLDEEPVWEILRKHSQSLDSIVRQALEATDPPDGFAVLAAGRLGTCEIDALSDADLVFLRSAECDSEQAERCALSLVALLSTYTREGSVIAVDTRIRPHGREGELVVSTRQLAQYFKNDAKGWETLAFSKARWIAGAENLARDVTECLCGLQERFAASLQFIPELRAVRKRLADSGGTDNLKAGPGGLYDIDFLTGMLEARSGLSAAGRQLSTRLEALIGRGLLSSAQGDQLLHAAALIRSADHATRVVTGRLRKWLPESDILRASVENIVKCPDLDRALRAEMRVVRGIFDSIFKD